MSRGVRSCALGDDVVTSCSAAAGSALSVTSGGEERHRRVDELGRAVSRVQSQTEDDTRKANLPITPGGGGRGGPFAL